VLSPFATDAAGLHQHQRQRKACVLPALALPAAHWILQQQQPLNVFRAEAR
jgi:hypothetical protein